MVVNSFNMRKKDVLFKLDKSSIGSWDAKIKGLCVEINKDKNYYTTSSCSGRIPLMVEQDKKAEGLFLKVYHDAVNFDRFLLDLKEVIEISREKKIIVKFKQEPAILHIACRDLKSAEVLMRKAGLSGWKRSGLISFGSRFILELLNTERLEFPIVDCGKVLVGDEFLGRCVEKGNENLIKNWEKVERLRKTI